LENPIPEVFFRISRFIEDVRFYTEIHPRAVLPTRRLQFDLGHEISGGARPFRVVISPDANVLLRSRKKEVLEIDIGSLRDMRLPDVLEPSRFGLSRGAP
jgi:hypothetical protein